MRIFYCDLTKAVAMLFIILLHLSAAPVTGCPVDSGEFINGVCVDAGTRWSVPIFVMISGALFLRPDKNIGIKQLWKKNILRLFVAFLFWSIFYTAYHYLVRGDRALTLMALLRSICLGEHHMWFVVMILTLYVLTPALRLIARDRTVLKYTIVVMFVLMTISGYSTVIPAEDIVETLVKKTWLNLGFIGYYLLGYYLSTIKVSNGLLIASMVLGGIGYAITLGGTLYFSSINGEYYNGFLANLTLNVALMAIAVFLIFKRLDAVSKALPNSIVKAVEKLGSLTMGVYLVHIFIINTLHLGVAQGLFPQVFLFALVVYLVSFTLSYVLRALPFVGKYIT